MRPFGKTLCTWADQYFVAILYDCGAAESGRRWVGYKLYDYVFDPTNPLIFCDDDYQVAAGTDTSSYPAVAGLLRFLSLKPGDVDEEYFRSYEERQLRWRDSHRCDDLEMLALEFDEDHA